MDSDQLIGVLVLGLYLLLWGAAWVCQELGR